MTLLFSLLFFSLALATSCGLLKQLNHNSQKAINEIDNHPLGKSLLSLISLYFNNPNADKTVTSLLRQIYEEIATEKDYNEQKNVKEQIICDQIIDQFNQAATFYKQQNAIANQVIEETASILGHLRLRESEIAKIIKDSVTEEKKLENVESSKEDILQIQNIIQACKEAINLLLSLESGASFIDLKYKLETFRQELLAQKTQKYGLIHNSFEKSLIDLSSQVNKEDIAKFVQLLNDYVSELEETKRNFMSLELKEKALQERETNELEEDIKKLQTEQKKLAESIENREIILAEAEKTLEINRKSMQSNENSLSIIEKDCLKKKQEYEKARSQIAEEIKVISSLQHLTETKLKDIKDYILERTFEETLEN